MIRKLHALTNNKILMIYVKNSSWMLSEYGLKIISGIFVGIYVARYLGPEKFGLLSYALAIVSVFTVVCRLGMDSILLRDLSRFPEKRKEYMGTAFILMILSSVICILILVFFVGFLETDKDVRNCILIISVGMLFQSAAVIDFNFQSEIKAKYSSIAKTLAIAVIAFFKVFLVWLQADLIMFAFVYSLELFLIAIALIVVHLIKRKSNFVGVFRIELIKPLLISAWPMVLASIAAILYTRIDQIMIKNMLGAYELGIYSSATKIYEGWVIIPAIISISILPAVVKIKTESEVFYKNSLSKIFSILFWCGFFIAIITSLAGKWIIYATFGDAFSDARYVLAIIMWTAPFTALGSMTARYLTVEGMEKKIAIRTLLGLVINIILNFILIPIYGIEGAAFSTLLTVFFSNYLINYFDRDLLNLKNICNSAIFFDFLKR